jgi:hypothetical protein
MKCKRRRKVKELGRHGVQAYMIERVEDCGGKAEHFVTPGKVGPPDLIISWPGAIVHFAETKTIGGRLEPWQKRDHDRRRAMGFLVVVPWNHDQVDDYISEHAPGYSATEP